MAPGGRLDLVPERNGSAGGPAGAGGRRAGNARRARPPGEEARAHARRGRLGDITPPEESETPNREARSARAAAGEVDIILSPPSLLLPSLLPHLSLPLLGLAPRGSSRDRGHTLSASATAAGTRRTRRRTHQDRASGGVSTVEWREPGRGQLERRSLPGTVAPAGSKPVDSNPVDKRESSRQAAARTTARARRAAQPGDREAETLRAHLPAGLPWASRDPPAKGRGRASGSAAPGSPAPGWPWLVSTIPVRAGALWSRHRGWRRGRQPSKYL
jgi:hypothetical protein